MPYFLARSPTFRDSSSAIHATPWYCRENRAPPKYPQESANVWRECALSIEKSGFASWSEGANVEHELHFVDASDALSKSQLRERSAALTAGTPWTRDADFEAVTAYFQPPSEDENVNVVRHKRDQYALWPVPDGALIGTKAPRRVDGGGRGPV